MQELASDEALTADSLHPTDEELAAYVDRRLRGKDRARVTQHLASCDRCYAIFSGVVRFQLEEDEEMGEAAGGKVIRFDKEARWLPRRWWWIPSTLAAALALLCIGLGSVAWNRSLALTKLVEPVEGRKEVATNLWQYSRFRGAGDAEGDSLELDRRAAVQAGALFVDFHLAAAAGDVEQASEIWRAIGRAVGNSLAGSEEAQAFLDEASAIRDQEALSRIKGSLGDRERALTHDEVLIPSYFRLGKWLEAGRLAAALKEPEFFDRWSNRISLKLALQGWQLDLPAEVREDLKTIDQAWGKRDYASLAKSFQSILDHNYNFTS